MKYLLAGDKPRFAYRHDDGKVDVAALRALPDEIAAASDLPAETRARLLTRAASLLERADNPHRDKAIDVRMSADDLEIAMYGDIGEGFFSEGITAGGVKRVLDAHPQRAVHLRLNSRGGDAFEGFAIRSLLVESGRQVTVTVDGLAASVASVIAMAASPGKLRMARNAVMMIHNSHCRVHGGVATLETAIEMLKAIDSGAADIYAGRAKASRTDIVAMMARETNMTAPRAAELGFADVVADASPAPLAVQQLDESDAALRALLLPSDRLVQDDNMTPEQKEIRKRLGLPESATDAEVFAKLDSIAAPGTPALQAPAALTAGDVERIVSASLAQHDTARNASQAHADACNAAVERFIAEGKIKPAQRAQAIANCGATAASLSAAVAYWESCDRILPASPKLGAPAGENVISPLQRVMMKSANVKEDTIKALIAEGL